MVIGGINPRKVPATIFLAWERRAHAVGDSIKYRQVIESLAKSLTSEDGVPAAEITAGEHRLGVRLPRALREYYLIAGRLDQLNRAHNRLYSAQDWFVDAGKLAFMEENQRVVFWGIPINGKTDDDPPVLQGVNISDQPIEWHPEHGCCSEFLVMMLHWQAVCGGMPFIGAADISSAALGRIRADWRFVGQMGELLAFARDGGAACVIGEGEALQLFAGSRTEVAFNLMSAEMAQIDVRLVRG
jgi:hypothetical protein